MSTSEIKACEFGYLSVNQSAVNSTTFTQTNTSSDRFPNLHPMSNINPLVKSKGYKDLSPYIPSKGTSIIQAIWSKNSSKKRK